MLYCTSYSSELESNCGVERTNSWLSDCDWIAVGFTYLKIALYSEQRVTILISVYLQSSLGYQTSETTFSAY